MATPFSPYHKDDVRVGAVPHSSSSLGDGPKWVCAPTLIPADGTALSFGSDGDIGFESGLFWCIPHNQSSPQQG